MVIKVAININASVRSYYCPKVAIIIRKATIKNCKTTDNSCFVSRFAGFSNL